MLQYCIMIAKLNSRIFVKFVEVKINTEENKNGKGCAAFSKHVKLVTLLDSVEENVPKGIHGVHLCHLHLRPKLYPRLRRFPAPALS